jgi:hypothetical protein
MTESRKVYEEAMARLPRRECNRCGATIYHGPWCGFCGPPPRPPVQAGFSAPHDEAKAWLIKDIFK